MSSRSGDEPPVGTLIGGDSLKLVEVLGVGGYGVVYRGEDTYSPNPKSYAVKCLLHSRLQRSCRRQIHIREIALHQISSAHPGVITLHCVVEEGDHTYIIMDYAPDSDLFTQILDHHRYVGDDALIKHVFLQLLDAVEYCHSLGIYHRDLKPENVLCFDDGYRVAITDFGLATTEKVSNELRTGSIYHMSPECQGGDFAPEGTYVPMSNDIWSLGIILLNLATGRNPWKTATPDDPTFQAYLRDPLGFFPSVLPVSPEVNDVLVRVLHIDERERITLSELREALEDVQSFYSEDVMFEGSMAKCPWEAGLDSGIEPSMNEGYDDGLDWQGDGLKSAWSKESNSPSSSYPWTPDVPGASYPAYHATHATSPHDSSLFQVPFSSSSPISSSDQTYWTTSQLSKDFEMDGVMDTLPQHATEMSPESSIFGVPLDEGSLLPPLSAPVTSLTSVYFPFGEDYGGQTGAASPTWLPSTKHMSLSSRSSSQSANSSEQMCAISFARSSTTSSDTSTCSRDFQSEFPPGASIYTSRDFHDSKATIFNFLHRPDPQLPPLATKNQRCETTSAYSRGSPMEQSSFIPDLDRPPSPDVVKRDAGRLWKTFSFGSTGRRRWFLLGKLFAS